MIKIVLSVLFLAGVATAGDVAFTTCSSAAHATIEKFSVSDCPDGATECTFIQGNTYTFGIQATTKTDAPTANSLPYKVTATVLGLPVVLVEGDACESVTCPILPGSQISFTLEKEITTTTPKLQGVTVSARGWANAAGTNPNAAFCASIKVSIE